MGKKIITEIIKRTIEEEEESSSMSSLEGIITALLIGVLILLIFNSLKTHKATPHLDETPGHPEYDQRGNEGIIENYNGIIIVPQR